MKRGITIFACLLFCASGAFAQYEKGDLTLNAGISFGLIGYGYGFAGSSSGFPPLSVNVEYSLNEMFAVGPYVGFFSRDYGTIKYNALSFGDRGTFHASGFLNENLDLDINEEKLDIYATLILGFETVGWKYDESLWGNQYNANSNSFIFGPVLGIRYNFNPNLGAFFEGGRGAFGYGTLGISVRL